MMIPILQIRKLGSRKFIHLSQRHMANRAKLGFEFRQSGSRALWPTNALFFCAMFLTLQGAKDCLNSPKTAL